MTLRTGARVALRYAFLPLWVWLCAAPIALFGADGDISEARVKAAFLYKFAAYVDWPAEVFARPESPLVVGVAGSDGIAEELAQVVAGRTMNNRPVTVKRLRRGDPLTGVHILFVGNDDSRARDFLEQAQGKPILTVADGDVEGTQRSVLKFVVAESKVRFEVSLDAAQRNGVRLSAQLLAVAKQVRGANP